MCFYKLFCLLSEASLSLFGEGQHINLIKKKIKYPNQVMLEMKWNTELSKTLSNRADRYELPQNQLETLKLSFAF